MREMQGMMDLAGSTVGTLRVGDLVSRQPARWGVVCSRCGTESTEQHSRLISGAATCRNNGCGREKVREAQRDSPAKAKRRADEKEAAKLRKEQEATAAKLAEAESVYTQTQREIVKTIRERLLTQKDDEAYLDPTTVGFALTQDQADAYNSDEARKFIEANPQFFNTRENRERLGEYFSRNGHNLVSAPMIEAAVRRLSEFGLLESAPPAPSPAFQRPQVNLNIEHVQPEPEAPDENVGIDQTTGERRRFSDFEIGHMDSESFRKTFRLSPEARVLGRRNW